MDSTESRLMDCFSLIFPDLSEKLIKQASTNSVGSWDSISTVNLVSIIEEEFGIQIELQDVEEVASFDRTLTFVRKALGERMV